GWVVRDRGARQAQLAANVRMALADALRFQKEGKWPEALAAARWAETLVQNGAAEPGVAEQVRALLVELTEQEATGRLLARLEEIRFLQADVNLREDRFALEDTMPSYREAFWSYGLQAEITTPADASALLQRQPALVQSIVAAALDHWLIL